MLYEKINILKEHSAQNAAWGALTGLRYDSARQFLEDSTKPPEAGRHSYIATQDHIFNYHQSLQKDWKKDEVPGLVEKTKAVYDQFAAKWAAVEKMDRSNAKFVEKKKEFFSEMYRAYLKHVDTSPTARHDRKAYEAAMTAYAYADDIDQLKDASAGTEVCWEAPTQEAFAARVSKSWSRAKSDYVEREKDIEKLKRPVVEPTDLADLKKPKVYGAVWGYMEQYPERYVEDVAAGLVKPVPSESKEVLEIRAALVASGQIRNDLPAMAAAPVVAKETPRAIDDGSISSTRFSPYSGAKKETVKDADYLASTRFSPAPKKKTAKGSPVKDEAATEMVTSLQIPYVGVEKPHIPSIALTTGRKEKEVVAQMQGSSEEPHTAESAAFPLEVDKKIKLTLKGADVKVAAWQKAMDEYAKEKKMPGLSPIDGAWGEDTNKLFEKLGGDADIVMAKLRKEGIELHPEQFEVVTRPMVASNKPKVKDNSK